MGLTRQQERRRRALRKIVQDNFATYADAEKTLKYSKSWIKSRLRPNATEAVSDHAVDAIKARLASAGIAGGDALR